MSSEEPRIIPIKTPEEASTKDGNGHSRPGSADATEADPSVAAHLAEDSQPETPIHLDFGADAMPGEPDASIVDNDLTIPDAGEALRNDGVVAGDGVEVEVVEEPELVDGPAVAGSSEQAEELAQLKDELERERSRMLRIAADFENFKRRAERERNDAVKFSNEGFLKALIPVMDNLDRALSATGEQQDVNSLREGVQMVFKELTKALAQFGIQAFSAMGEKFDPVYHEAVLNAESDDVPKGSVMAEYQKGYLLNERLIRPALVVVSKGPPPESTPVAAVTEESEETPDPASE